MATASAYSRPSCSHPQSSGPESIKQWSAADRRSSLVRSNAVHRKPPTPISPDENEEFPYLPAHWRQTLRASTISGSSEHRAFLREARAKRNKDAILTTTIYYRDNGKIPQPATELGPQLHPEPALVGEECSAKTDAQMGVLKLGEIQPLRMVQGQQPSKPMIEKENHENRANDAHQEEVRATTVSQETQALKVRINALEEELEEQKALLRAILHDGDESKDSDTNTKDFNTMAMEIKTQLQDHRRLLSSLGSVLCTRRGVMLLKAMQYQQKEHPQSVSKKGNGVGSFDDIVSLSEVADISQALDTRPQLLSSKSTCIRVCSICNIPRFVRVLSEHTTSFPARQSEFSSEYSTTQCCRESICDWCFIPALVSNFSSDWWFDQGYDGWMKCPIPHCRSFLPIYLQQQVKDLLPKLGDNESALHEAQFAHCLRLRGALDRLVPRPTVDALQKAAALHRQLVDHGWMIDHTQVSNPVDIGSLSLTLQVVSISSHDETETFKVPVFVGNLVRKAARECVVCAESLADMADNEEDEASWSAATEGFPGDWARQIRPFPSPDALPVCSTSHTLDVCRSCLSNHITTQLQSRGINACDSLSCPSLGCDHQFTHEEVRRLVTDDIFARYDKLKLLKALSTEPDFRWCLRENCENGQIHQILDQLGDGPGDRRRNHVECDECGFEMCFHHQIPWHRGLSCVEYDRMKAGLATNDNDGATQEWLLANTKMCRCGAYVEKQGGCFHMTCSSCLFEFCWECMADWNLIQGYDPVTGQMRGYNRLAHAPDCWFRGLGATRPTQLRGDTLEDALRWLGD